MVVVMPILLAVLRGEKRNGSWDLAHDESMKCGSGQQQQGSRSHPADINAYQPGFEGGRGTDVRSLTRKQWPPCFAWTLRIVFYQVNIYDVIVVF